MDHKTISLADQVFERLETDILTTKYARDEILTELRLCGELGVSRTPVREALRRLEQEHLVESTSKGMRVLGITRQDFEDMCTIRIRLEELAVRGFILNMSEESLAELREVVELQGFYLDKGDAEHMKIMDSRFHETIYSRCGSMILRDTLAPLHKKVQTFRRISIGEHARAMKSWDEHRRIMEAIAHRDSELAEQLITDHVKNAMDSIVKRNFIQN